MLSSGYNTTKHSLKLSTKTAGPDLTFNTSLTDQVTGDLKASYKGQGFNVDSTFASSQKVTGSVALTELLPGLKTTLSATVPDQRSGKLALDYSRPHLTLKSSLGLVATPKAECSVSTGAGAFTVGGEAGYDARTSALTKWSVGAQYSAEGTTVAAVLADKGETAKACLAHELSSDVTLGAEAVHKIKAGSTTFTLGGAAKLNGSTVKAKVDSTGLASALLETEVQPKAKMTISAACNALDLGKAPKVGISMDVKA